MIKQQSKYIAGIFFSTLLLLMACGGGSSSEEQHNTQTEEKEKETIPSTSAVEVALPDLMGYWEVLAAKRNGKDTESLDGAYFHFKEDQQLETNILGEPSSQAFQLDGGAIKQTDGSPKLEYIIERFEDSLMVLSTDISSYHFQFQLKQGEPEDTEEDLEGEE